MSTIRIQKLVTGGQGLAFDGGAPVFAALTAPGDRIRPLQTVKKRGATFVTRYDILEPSPMRRQPPCPWYGECGGCDWMHIEYRYQTALKGAVVAEALSRGAGLGNFEPEGLVASPVESGWRRRARLHLRDGTLGFFGRGSHRMVPWEDCLVLTETLNRSVAALRRAMASGQTPAFQSVEITGEAQEVTLYWIGEEPRKDLRRRWGDLVGDTLSGVGIRLAGQRWQGREGSHTAGSLVLRSGPRLLTASPGTFIQVNGDVNRRLAEKVLDHLQGGPGQMVLDLYCGNGNLSLPAAAAGCRVTGVESSSSAVGDARASTGVLHLSVLEEDVSSYLDRAAADGSHFDSVIADPPRSGLPRRAAPAIAATGAARMVYVSCDPATLARDVARLAACGFAPRRYSVLDMFPNSSHVETVLLMQRG